MGTCRFKLGERYDCLYRTCSGPVICNLSGEKADRERLQHCPRYVIEHELDDISPGKFCCVRMEKVFHQCAEPSGCMAGAFDIRNNDADGKDVWSNYERTRFAFCPFCGAKQ